MILTQYNYRFIYFAIFHKKLPNSSNGLCNDPSNGARDRGSGFAGRGRFGFTSSSSESLQLIGDDV
jgi:hypothetical protein